MMAPFTPAERLTMTFERQQWQQLLGLLQEVPAPHRITDPLIRSIMEQWQQQQQEPALPASLFPGRAQRD